VRDLWHSDWLPIAETTALLSYWPLEKLACEQILIDTCAAEDLRFAILRYFHARADADPDRELSERHDRETHLIPLAIGRCDRNGPPLQILGATIQPPTAPAKDFIHVCDLAVAHVEALRRLNAGQRLPHAQFGPLGRATSVRKVISAVERVTGEGCP